jgi:hypothetical protein
MAAANANRRNRSIQAQVAKADKARPKQEPNTAMQAGARKYPAPPFPKQHQSKPARNPISIRRRCTMPFLPGIAQA